jgi:uncharacterized repeat protein (TIGR03803 family)
MTFARHLAITAIVAAIFAMAPVAGNASTFTTLYSFTGGANGGNPTATLIYRDGALYGTVPGYYGSKESYFGNVFKVDAATGKYKLVHAVQGGADGASPAPFSGVIYAAGALYGTTQGGGGSGCVVNGYAYGCGTIFSIDPKTAAETVLYAFSQDANSSQSVPQQLLYEAGTLYATTAYGGKNGDGSVFSFNLTSGAFATIYSFNGGADGKTPNPQLLYQNGLLYGTTQTGGGKGCRGGGCGTVFAIDPATGVETVLHAFRNGGDATKPDSNLFFHAGWLYGATATGGGTDCRDGCGTFYAINVVTGAEKIVYRYETPNSTPSGLTFVQGNIYETLPTINHSGQLQQINLKTLYGTVLWAFDEAEYGFTPTAPPTYHNGVIFGTAFGGGNEGNCIGGYCGTVFKLVP